MTPPSSTARGALCQLEIPQATTLRALELAEAAGCVSVLNAAPVPPGASATLSSRRASCARTRSSWRCWPVRTRGHGGTVAGAVCAAKDLQRRGRSACSRRSGATDRSSKETYQFMCPSSRASRPSTRRAPATRSSAPSPPRKRGLSTLAAVRAAGVVAARRSRAAAPSGYACGGPGPRRARRRGPRCVGDSPSARTGRSRGGNAVCAYLPLPSGGSIDRDAEPSLLWGVVAAASSRPPRPGLAERHRTAPLCRLR